MGSSSSKEESQGVKAVVSESSSSTTGGFHLIEIIGIFFIVRSKKDFRDFLSVFV